MIAPRWRKVLRDIWENRARTVLIVVTIAAGLFAIGTMAASTLTTEREFPAQYQAIQPAHLVFSTSPFPADLSKAIGSIKGVTEAEARRELRVRLLEDEASDTWRDLLLYDIVDYNDQRVDKILPVSGAWPPPKNTLLMERGSMQYLSLYEGQVITIKTSDGKQSTLKISGVAHDLYHMPAFMEGTVYGYITDDTLQHLGQDVSYNEMYVRLAGDVHDPAYVRSMRDHIVDHLEDSNVVIYTTDQPRPDGYPLDYVSRTVSLLLIMLGVLILMLGVCLVIGTMSALVAQQARQIAIMKAVGGRTHQVLGVYLGMVLILGLASLLLAIPFSTMAARWLVSFVSGMLNFDSRLDRLPPEILALEIGLAIVVPVVSALGPVLASARRSPALALSEYGQGRIWSGVRWVDRLLHALRGLTRLERLAFRNPFRNRNRLIISLIMLSLAGGSFVTVMNLRASMRSSVGTMLSFWQYDFSIAFNRPYRVARLREEGLRVPGVKGVEGWGFEMTRRVRPDGSESNPIFFFAAPADSPLVHPTLLQGRWLLPTDKDGIVVGMGLLDVEPDLGLGKEIVLKVRGDEQHFHIVGITEMIGNQTVGYVTYTTLETFNRMAHQVNHANLAVITTNAANAAQRQAMGSAVEKAYEDAGLGVTSVFQMDDERMQIDSSFAILINLLMVMVFLLSFVGGLGLTSTMSLNVLERSREIGVIRAFGGSNASVFKLVVLEGVAIGLMSWLLSLLWAIPLTWLFCDMIGRSFMSMPLDYQYSAGGALLWLGLVIILSAISSSLPAANAVRLTVREVLSYE